MCSPSVSAQGGAPVGATPMMHSRSHIRHPQFLDHRPELAEHIRTCSHRPRVVFDETHRFNPEVRPDWLRVRVDMVGTPPSSFAFERVQTAFGCCD